MKTNDILLTELSRRFLNMDPLPQPDNFDYKIAFDNLGHWPNLNPTVCKRYMNARFYFGGKQRVVAVSTIQRAYEVARFADLIVTRFWRYRIRAQVPSDANTCFGLEGAKADYEFLKHQRPEVIHLIDDLEKHFVALGVFRDGASAEAEPKPEKRASALSVVRGVILKSFEEVAASVNNLNADLFENVKALDIQNKKLDEIARRHADTADTQATTNTRLVVIEALLNKVVHLHADTASRLTAIESSIVAWGKPVAGKCQPGCDGTHELGICDSQTELPTEPFKAGVGFADMAGNKAGVIAVSPSVFSVGAVPNKKQPEA
jgi:hypothetical protein